MKQTQEVTSTYKPKVLLSRALLSQIHYLHNICPKNAEWSGLLIYEVTKGSVDDLENLEIKAHGMFPMDIGDATFTSFEASDHWLTTFQRYPQIDPLTPTPNWYVGKIHSHHSMAVFHSGTDKADLYETAGKLPMFLSLIVNYECSTDCELAIFVEAEETIITRVRWKLKGWKNRKKESKLDKKDLTKTYVLKCTVKTEQEDWLEEQVKTLLEEKAKKSIPVHYGYGNAYSGYDDRDYYGRSYEHGTYGKVVKHNDKKQTGKKVSPTDFTHSTKTYTTVLNEISDLITLGAGPNLVPVDALKRVDSCVLAYSKDQYQKAFVVYFSTVWYPTEFAHTPTSEQEVISAMRALLIHHQSQWITTIITKAINELEIYYRKAMLRTV